MTAQELLQLAQQAFTSSTTYFDASIRRQAEAAIRQFQGMHPAGSKYLSDSYKARARFFRPKTRATIRKNEAGEFLVDQTASGPPAIDGIGPTARIDEYWKEADEARRRRSGWAA